MEEVEAEEGETAIASQEGIELATSAMKRDILPENALIKLLLEEEEAAKDATSAMKKAI